MIQVRRSQDRGFFENDWLRSYHTFSFSEYHDPQFMGFSALRVINEDFVRAGSGFGTHPHRNMEIVTFVIEGVLEHKDSLGNTALIRPGEIQRMSAGSGIRHSEWNPSKEQAVHLLQIWILPLAEGHEPSYEQKIFSPPANGFQELVSAQGGENVVTVDQDMKLSLGCFSKAEQTNIVLNTKRSYWLQIVIGELSVNEHTVSAGDGVAVHGEEKLKCQFTVDSRFLLFDLS